MEQPSFFQHLFLYLPLMKFFFFILSCFMLYMSCLPCNDSKIESDEKSNVKISAIVNHPQDNHDTESCSPFCSCSCCHASVFYQALPFYNIAKQLFQTKEYPLYTSSFYSKISFSIWQPPKLS